MMELILDVIIYFLIGLVGTGWVLSCIKMKDEPGVYTLGLVAILIVISKIVFHVVKM